MAAQCSRREICTGQARSMLQRYLAKIGTPSPEQQSLIESIIKRLIADAFIDDNRFLNAYLKDKITFALWGPKKITAQLLEWGFSQETVDKALAEHTEELYESLRKVIEKKSEQLERENAKKVASAEKRYAAKIEKLQEAVEEAAKAVEEAKGSGKNAKVELAYKGLRSAQQKLQRAKYDAANVQRTIASANRKKIISHALSKGFSLNDIVKMI